MTRRDSRNALLAAKTSFTWWSKMVTSYQQGFTVDFSREHFGIDGERLPRPKLTLLNGSSFTFYDEATPFTAEQYQSAIQKAMASIPAKPFEITISGFLAEGGAFDTMRMDAVCEAIIQRGPTNKPRWS